MQDNKNTTHKTGKDSQEVFKTDGGKTKSNAIDIPSISLPKGGGALKGIDEKFTVNAINGTASFSIPLPFSPSRGAAPALSLSYNSGLGNGPFGLGWDLGLPSIKRKTDKALPTYSDDIDTYIFSGAEDLVPQFIKNADGSFPQDQKGNYILKEDNSSHPQFAIRFYNPRIEGLFARIERWTEKTTGNIKWRVITKDNITTLFGWSEGSRICDPANPKKIFEWFPEFIFDDKGNCSHYIYKKEDDKGFIHTYLHNRNRFVNGKITYTNLYIEKVLYGNQTAYQKFDSAFPPEENYIYSTVFDYGAYSQVSPYSKINDWAFRPDAFSEYKAGFEIRTTRLCNRVLFYHHFEEYDGLVRSLNFKYDFTFNDFTFLISIKSLGYIKRSATAYSSKCLPPIEFKYQKNDWNKDVKIIADDDLVHSPSAIDEQQYQFTDLFNEGLSGILTEQANGWYYKHNLGNGKFEHAKLVTPKPSFIGLGKHLQLADLDGDGGKQFVSFGTDPKGYFELDDENVWQGFKNFRQLPNINFGDPNTRMMDLNGDGIPEILISEENVFTWYAGEGRNGFSAAQKITKPFDEEAGPYIVFADEKQTIFLASMSGDGMTDIVRIRNGEVCYWPNLGYGKFGAKVAMDNAPIFDSPDLYNPAWLRLADIDGSGTTDIIYLGKNKFTCWMNLSGNSFSTMPFEIDAFPEIHDQSRITVTDILGNGVSCIVWSSSLSKDTYSPLRYIDLMNSKKPHIMVSYKNNLGKEVFLEYIPSTKFYIEDKLAGNPWLTKLHFPVHCIAKTVTIDKISGYHFASCYKYHHGYYDHTEREFRGFGMVEQIDTEDYEPGKISATNITEDTLQQPPVISKTWAHTGAVISRKNIMNPFAKDYWQEEMNRHGFAVDDLEKKFPDTVIVDKAGNDISNTLTTEEWLEAIRACKGMAIRSEVFSKEKLTTEPTPGQLIKILTPYSVSTHNCIIEMLQPRAQNRHAVFIVKEREAIEYSYERDATDPRIVHNINILLDEYGNILEAAAIVYPRLENKIQAESASLPETAIKAQQTTLISFIENKFTTDDIWGNDAYRLRMPVETKTYQLKGVAKTDDYYLPSDFKNILARADTAFFHEIDKEPRTITPGNKYIPLKRLIEHVRTVYRNNNLIDPLPNGEFASHGLVYENYQLAYTRELLNDIYGQKASATEIESMMQAGKFIPQNLNKEWWIPSGKINFIDTGETIATAQQRFYLPISYTDPYGATSKVQYGNYFLFIQETKDEFLNTTTVREFNYRTLSPKKMEDINGNLSTVIADELGLIKAMALMGRLDEADNLDGIEEITENEEPVISRFFQIANDTGVCDAAILSTNAKQLLKNATVRFVYDFEVYQNSGGPVVVASVIREEHHKEKPDSAVQISLEYSNGLGQVIMKKLQAEPGDAWQTNGTGVAISTPTGINLRWIGNGRTILNNKGNPVKQYEPYFSVSPRFENEAELTDTGVTPVMYYDAMSRLIKTEMPDGTFSKVEFDSWKQVSYDTVDTVMDSQWYINHASPLPTISEPSDPLQRAAWLSAIIANTPSTVHFDTLGRPFLSVQHNRSFKIDELTKKVITNPDDRYNTSTGTDMEGNLRTVTDAKGHTVMQYKYDMLGNMVYQNSMDAGERWLMINIAGNPLNSWDVYKPEDTGTIEETRFYSNKYDKLHRPTELWLTINNNSAILIGRFEYQDAQQNNTNNLNGHLVKHYDSSGLTETVTMDFKGRPLEMHRRLVLDNQSMFTDWQTGLHAKLEAEIFIQITEYDALKRMTRLYNWHRGTGSKVAVYEPKYCERGTLQSEQLIVQANRNNVATGKRYYTDSKTEINNAIAAISYDAKGQREFIKLGNGIITNYTYDKNTFRLKNLRSTSPNAETCNSDTKNTFKDSHIIQDLDYYYDAAGNITEIHDRAFDDFYFQNQKVAPVNKYEYDALYRLTKATGRENGSVSGAVTQQGGQLLPGKFPCVAADAFRNYSQSWQYDEVGNILQVRHSAGTGSWTRDYAYAFNDPRQKASNRLWQTWTSGDRKTAVTYHYDSHGSILNLGNVPDEFRIQWDHNDMITSIYLGGGGVAHYQYDEGKQRTRKTIVRAGITEERIYLGGMELYRRKAANGKLLEEIETLHLFDGTQRMLITDQVIKTDNNSLGIGNLYRYTLSNHLGSATLELNEKTEIISYEEYHPYGTTAYSVKTADIKSTAKRYRYTGMERDEESGLAYHSARYYIGWLGRWLSADSNYISDGLNLYKYAKLNPLNFIDVTGLATDLPPKVGGSGSPNLGERVNIEMHKYLEASDILRSKSGLFPVGWNKKVTHEDEKGTRAQSDLYSAPHDLGIDTKGRHVKHANNTNLTLNRGDIDRHERRKEITGAKEPQLIVLVGPEAGKYVKEAKKNTAELLKGRDEKIQTSVTTLKRIIEARKNIEKKINNLKENTGIIGVFLAALLISCAENASTETAQKESNEELKSKLPEIKDNLTKEQTKGALITVHFELGRPSDSGPLLTRFSGITITYAPTQEEAQQTNQNINFISSNEWYWHQDRKNIEYEEWVPPVSRPLINNSNN